MKPEIRDLRRLAALYGIQAGFRDAFGRRRTASPEVLMGILRALGAPIERIGEDRVARREKILDTIRRVVEPVLVAWDGRPPVVMIGRERRLPHGRLECEIRFEGGDRRHLEFPTADLPVRARREKDGTEYSRLALKLPGRWPSGYHRLLLTLDGKTSESLIISAPSRCFDPARTPEDGGWGLFLPLYSIRSARNWGCGDFTDLAALQDWVDDAGGDLVATLPFFSAFLDEPFDPSPYAPASRLFWNDLYVDVDPWLGGIESAGGSPGMATAELQSQIDEMRSAPRVDFRRLARLKSRVIKAAAAGFFSRSETDPDRRDFREFAAAHPDVEEYARFRAVLARRRVFWHEWPEAARRGDLREEPIDPGEYDTHRFAQWLAARQLERLSARRHRGRAGLFLDFPLGVHRGGYDTWRYREIFVHDANVGAPADTAFPSGQNWGFPPLHPERSRRQGHAYVGACLRHLMRKADAVRIDHVMGLHRLYWIPDGMEADQGAYVRYPAEEYLALLSLESHRHACAVVGEDLGTVPGGVRRSMRRHNIRRMFILQYEARTDSETPVNPVPAGALAALNTHDMPTFAGYWNGRDIEDRARREWIDLETAGREKAGRAGLRMVLVEFLRRGGWLCESDGDVTEIAAACLRFLADSEAWLVMVNPEDLWGETEPHNIPGAPASEGFWTRRIRHPLEDLGPWREVAQRVRDIASRRRTERKKVWNEKKAAGR